MADIDQHVARLTPVYEAVLGIDDYDALDHPVGCPVCETADALTPERINLLREHLRRTQSLTDTARSAVQNLTDARRDLDQLVTVASRTVPPVASWTDEQLI